jgi:DNA (cytosine-5)-methyltransferase 1
MTDMTPRNDGISNTLTTVQKDNYVIQVGNLINTDSFGGNPQAGRVYSTDGISPTLNTMQGGQREPKIVQERFFKQAFETMEKYNAQDGDVIDAFNQRVNNTGVSPTLTTRPEGFKTAILPVQNYRIRKLTPLECWRLMDFTDDEFYAAQFSGVSNSQLYKQAGNSICVCVLQAIFKELLA